MSGRANTAPVSVVTIPAGMSGWAKPQGSQLRTTAIS